MLKSHISSISPYPTMNSVAYRADKKQSKKSQKHRMRRQGFTMKTRCCHCLIASAVFCIILAGILSTVAIIATKKTTIDSTSTTTSTTTATTTTTTTVTTTTTTTTTTTITTTTTSTTSTSTSTSISETTTTTSTTSTTTTITTTTTTTTTTALDTSVSTTIAATTELSTTEAETSTTPPICAGYILSNILLELHNAPNQSYTYYSFVYQATASRTTLMFCFLNRQYFWALDNVSMKDSSTNTELLVNGNFTVANWNAWTAYNSVYYSSGISTGYSSWLPYAGAYFYLDVQYTNADGIFQNVTTVAGRNYTISFYLANPRGGNFSVALVSIGS